MIGKTILSPQQDQPRYRLPITKLLENRNRTFNFFSPAATVDQRKALQIENINLMQHGARIIVRQLIHRKTRTAHAQHAVDAQKTLIHSGSKAQNLSMHKTQTGGTYGNRTINNKADTLNNLKKLKKSL